MIVHTTLRVRLGARWRDALAAHYTFAGLFLWTGSSGFVVRPARIAPKRRKP